jgi:hypothetical protein
MIATTLLPDDLWSGAAALGEPLPFTVRGKIEDAFGADFSGVRVHVDAAPARLGAAAFTRGEDLYFLPEVYDPESPGGAQVLAHELTHVLQQRAGQARNPFGKGIAVLGDSALESEAESFAERYGRMSGGILAGGCWRNVAGRGPAEADESAVIQCLQFHGALPGGGFGQLNANQLRDWILNKSNRQMNPANVLQCANYFLGHDGKKDGGFGNYTFNRNQVFHISHGQRGSDQGCTLFFANSGGNVGVIVAIGYHFDNGCPKAKPRYQLDWVKDNWHIGNTICP